VPVSMILYDFEDEHLLRRIGAALMMEWASLPGELRAKLLEQAASTFDREECRDLSAELKRFVDRFDSGSI
jgi:hypothetical protein